MKRKTSVFIGIIILIILAISYFININVENGINYTINSSLLGVIIFYNPFILAFYIFIAVVLIKKSFSSV